MCLMQIQRAIRAHLPKQLIAQVAHATTNERTAPVKLTEAETMEAHKNNPKLQNLLKEESRLRTEFRNCFSDTLTNGQPFHYSSRSISTILNSKTVIRLVPDDKIDKVAADYRKAAAAATSMRSKVAKAAKRDKEKQVVATRRQDTAGSTDDANKAIALLKQPSDYLLVPQASTSTRIIDSITTAVGSASILERAKRKEIDHIISKSHIDGVDPLQADPTFNAMVKLVAARMQEANLGDGEHDNPEEDIPIDPALRNLDQLITNATPVHKRSSAPIFASDDEYEDDDDDVEDTPNNIADHEHPDDTKVIVDMTNLRMCTMESILRPIITQRALENNEKLTYGIVSDVFEQYASYQPIQQEDARSIEEVAGFTYQDLINEFDA
ncbi:hypothetical protein JR316_0013136 [Psilocybe cubensis]|uniref:Uncharacterized protein n=1 Tax=Psilocybe cubensis TaxID=181762 RepID=A0ACB8GGJ6_PSICU|nr:hypothetical protein JR316_0013136 [Psilocybe cubensis]KAH9474672.1 hypothetical protein JR316_0013136 [Psilocybe cubensis]